MSQYSHYPQAWHEENNVCKSAIPTIAFINKMPSISLDDSRYIQEDQHSRCDTPEMTRGSSNSSVVACTCPGQKCVCQANYESRSQHSEVENALSSTASGSGLPRTPEITSSRIHLIHSQKQKDSNRFPGLLTPEIAIQFLPGSSASRAVTSSHPQNLLHNITHHIDQPPVREICKYDQRKTGSAPKPDALRSYGTTAQQLKLCGNRIVDENSEPETTDEDDEDDEDDDSENDDDDWSGQDGDLEARVLDAVDHDLPLAAHLIPFLHKIVYSELTTKVKRTVGPWREGLTKCPTEAGASSSENAPSSQGATNASNNSAGKRQRNPGSNGHEQEDGGEEEEEDDDEDGKRYPKRLKDDADPGRVMQSPRLACPFHKKDPVKYGIQHEVVENGKKSDYRSCAGPGFKSIQRLKEHLRRKHYPVQCDRCYHIFDGPDRAVLMPELQKHRQLQEACQKNSPSLREGISESQMAILDKKNNKKKMQNIGSSSVDKWNEIWTVLFPETEIPQTPWYDKTPNEIPPHSPSIECNDFLKLLEAIFAHKMGQGDIYFEEGMVQRILGMAKSAFDLWSNTRRATDTTSSSNSTSARTHPQTTLLSGSFQVIPPRHQYSSGTSSAPVGSEAYSLDVSTGSPMAVKPPRRNQPNNSGHSVAPIFVAMPQTHHSGYANTLAQGVLDEHSGHNGFAAEHLINFDFPDSAIAMHGNNLPDAEEWCMSDYSFNNGTSAANLSPANFTNGTRGVNPAQLIRSPSDRTHNLTGTPADWMYPNPSQAHYGARPR